MTQSSVSLRHSLFWKLSQSLLIMLVFLGAIIVLITAFFVNKVNYQLEQTTAWNLAKDIAIRISPLIEDNKNFWELQKVIDSFRQINPKIDIYLLSDSGEVIADFGVVHEVVNNHISLEPITRFLQTTDRRETPIFGVDPRDHGEQIVFSASKIKLYNGYGYVYVNLLNSEYKTASKVFQAYSAITGSTIFFVIGLTATGIVGILLFYILTARFRKMINIVDKYERGDFTERVPEGGKDECAVLGRTINHMANAIVSNIEELKRKDTLRRELIADLSHDLRKPVALISGFSEVILNRDPTLSEDSRRNCEVIARNTDSLTRLLGELFELAKFEAKETKPVLKRLALGTLFEEIVEDYKPRAEESGIFISAIYDDRLPIVSADVAMISRVITNLLENALRYTPAGGRIIVSAEQLEDKVRVSVSDSGIGIPEKDLPFVFDRMYQVEDSQTRSNGLSGLGLAIVKRIIEAHGSEIFVSSKENEGTNFSFYLS